MVPGMSKPDGDSGAQAASPGLGGMGKSNIASMFTGKGSEGGGGGIGGGGKLDIKSLIAKLKAKGGEVTKRSTEPTGNLVWKREDASKAKPAESEQAPPPVSPPEEADSSKKSERKKKKAEAKKQASASKERRQELGGGKIDIKSIFSNLKAKASGASATPGASPPTAGITKRAEHSIRNIIWKRADAPDPKSAPKAPTKPGSPPKEPSPLEKKDEAPEPKEADKGSAEEAKPKGERKSKIKALLAKLRSKKEGTKGASAPPPAE
ncbi:hypothetical protein PCANC_21533 [Puccinia coronata f. sp. avenae]|uniref:Uncharacterized protein n=1 Tax=Puccinia coronata f. sp. avenae TaxID=200324 RepID=A0A2N5S9J9_9BASI|nr:hypothetical protein PCANC_21533 [Puccinia coronata f. sp. avenae]